MQVNKFKIGLLSAAAVLGLGVFSSCSKDFQGDIDGINNRIDKLEGLSANVDALKKAVDSGKVIQSVVKTDNGIKIVVGGETYEITNGKDGANGEQGPAATITVDEKTGNWVINGKVTEYPSRGVAGKDGKDGINGKDGKDGKDGINGKDGKDGINGKDGKAGIYYVPGTEGAEKGFWVKVDPNTLDDKGLAKRTVTTDKWLPEGTITAVFENGVLTLFNVKGGEGDAKSVTINPALTSLEIFPDLVYKEDEPLVIFKTLSVLSCDCDFTGASTEKITMLVNMGATEDDVKDVKLLYNSPDRLTDLRTAAIAPEVVGKPVFSDYNMIPGMKMMTIYFRINPLKTNRVLGEDQNGNYTLTPRWFEDPDSGNWFQDKTVDHIYVAAQNRFGKWVYSNPVEVASRDLYVDNLQLVRAWKNPDHRMPRTVEEAKDVIIRLQRHLGPGAVRFTPSEEWAEVIQVPYDKSFDLSKEVRAYLEDYLSDEELADYNLHFTWDLNDENGKPIVFTPDRNKTPQQEYIKQISGSTFQAKVYDLDPNASAVGRTPIVHVSLTICKKDGASASSDLCKGDDCPVEKDGVQGDVCKLDFFLPLFIVEKPEEVVEPVTLQLIRETGKVDYCEEYRDTLSTKEMTTLIYHKLNEENGIPYSTFVKNYRLQNYYPDSNEKFNPDTDYVGYFTQIYDPYQDPFNTDRLVWRIPSADLYKYRGQEVKGRAVFSDGLNYIYIVFTTKLPKVTFNASALQLQTDWTSDYSAMLLNSQVPDKTKSENPGVVTYLSYLENGFYNANTDLDNPDALKIDGKVVEKKIGLKNFRYWFAFAKEQTPLTKEGVTYKLYVKEYGADADADAVADAELANSPISGDGLRDGNIESDKVFKHTYTANDNCPECVGAHRRHYTELWAQKIVNGKAVKVDGKTDHLVVGLSGENNSYYEVNKNSKLALEILNADPQFLRADIQLFVMDDCDHCIKVTGLSGEGDTFKAIFLRPLDIASANKKFFVNGANVGDEGAVVDLNDNYTLSDWRINSEDPLVKGMASFAKHDWYTKFYNVQIIVPNMDDIKKSITLEGYKDRDGNKITKPMPSMNFRYTPIPGKDFGKLEYWNNDTNIHNNFWIVVPVTVKYEYGEYVEPIKIEVKKTGVKPQN